MIVRSSGTTVAPSANNTTLGTATVIPLGTVSPNSQPTTAAALTMTGTVSLPTSSQHLSSVGVTAASTPAKRSMHGQNFSVDSAAYQEILDRRKTFRFRGSLGPTVASAPSVEQEDYRTPRPSIPSIKNGKSFDLGGGFRNVLASDSNGLIKVSADFLRLNGSRQQFRNLLSARKKLGQLPPAYTRIDYSHDSTDSGLISRPHHHGPVITVEDTNGSQLNLSSNHFNHRLSISSVTAVDSQKSSVEKPNENGGLQSLSPSGPSSPPLSNACFKRTNSRYGQPLDESQVKMVYKIRSQRLNTRVQITDRCLVLALIGIIFMVLDTEMCGRGEITKDHAVSLSLRTLAVFSTLALLVEIVHYHINEVLLDLVDCGADDWRVVVTWRRFAQFVAEFVLCTLCPLPGTGDIQWVVLEPSRNRDFMPTHRAIPVDVPLSLLMIGRLYLIGRFMVLHSKQFQDASTRTLAALNRIQVNFTFVMKTVLDQKPIWCLSVFLFCFWLVAAWSFAQVERIGRGEEPYILYLNALWFIAITFNSNGYGDIVPKTIAGRIIAVCVGISGAIISSILIAVISRKILLSQGQRNVNNFMNDSKLTQRHKHAAARVLQKTWHIYKSLNANNCPDHLLRQHQRKFLDAIHEFRRIKNKMRVFSESSSASMQQMTRLMTEMHTSMQKLVASQDEMRAQIEVLQRAMRNHFTHANAARCGTLLEDDTPAIEAPSAVAPGTPPTAHRARRGPLAVHYGSNVQIHP